MFKFILIACVVLLLPFARSEFALHGQIMKVVWSPDGEHLAVAAYDGVYVYDASDLTIAPTAFDIGAMDFTHIGGAGLAYSPDGAMLAFGGENRIYLWDTESGEVLADIPVPYDYVWMLEFTPDGTKLLAGTVERFLQINDLTSFMREGSQPSACMGVATTNANLRDGPGLRAQRRGSLPAGQSSPIWSRAVDRDGMTWYRLPDYVWFTWVRSDLVDITGDCDGLPLVIKADVEENRAYGLFTEIAVAPDGQTVATFGPGGDMNTINVFNIETGTLHATYFARTEHPALSVGGNGLDISADGTLLAASGNGVRLWNIRSGSLYDTLPMEVGGASNIEFAPDGPLLFISAQHFERKIADRLVVYDTATRSIVAEFGEQIIRIMSIAVHPTGDWIATGGGDGTVRIYDVESGTQLQRVSGFATFGSQD